MKKKHSPTVTDKIKRFLRQPIPNIIGEIFNIPEEFLYLTEMGLGKALETHYETIRLTNGLDDTLIETVRYSFENPHTSNFPNTPTQGLLFLEDKQKPGDRLVLKSHLQQYNRFDEPFFQIFIPRKRKDIAVKFTQRLHEAIKSFKGLHLMGNGKPLRNMRKFTWLDMVLSDAVKRIIQHNVIDFIKKRELFQRRNIQMRRGLMLYGLPGVGKTMLSIVLANETDANLVIASSQHMGGPANVARVFDLARFLAPPTIVCLEDLDLIGGKERETTFHKELLGELLNQLDSFACNDGLIIIASTNDISVFDKALGNRPGRFDIKLEMPLPDDEHRAKLFHRFTESIKIADDVDVSKMIQQMQGLSCAHINEIVNYAKILNTERSSESDDITLSKEDFASAMAIWNGDKKSVGFNN